MEMEDHPQAKVKRKRRPSVRLGEFPYDPSEELWLQAALKQRPHKPLWKKPEDEEQKKPVDVVKPDLGLTWNGNKVRRKRRSAVEEVKDEAEEEKSSPLQVDDEAPSSDSVGVMGSESKAAEDDHSEEGGDGGANPHSSGVVEKQQRCIIIIPAVPQSNGDDIQGAIDDGPAKGSSTVKLGRQQAARRSTDHSKELSGKAKGAIAIAGVGEWLRGLGLGRYSELFALNEVDADVLPLLTMDDLREMGVDAVGARRKMFTHIQELGQLRRV